MINDAQKEAMKGLMKLVKDSILTWGQYRKSKDKASTATADERTALKKVADDKRTMADNAISQFIGNITTDEGKERARQWNYFCQNCHILNLVGSQVYFYVDPKYGNMLRGTAENFLEGHKLLGWEVRFGINPRSVQDLATALDKALVKAREDCDPDKVRAYQTVLGGLKEHAKNLLKMKPTQKPAQTQQPQGQTLGDTLPPGAVKELKKHTVDSRPARKSKGKQRP